MSKNNLFKSWLKEAQQMLVEALPDAKEVVDGARIEIVSIRSWISVRDRVARECGESAHKRMLADKNIKDPNNGGEFISGSKGWAIDLKKEYIYEKGRFIEAVIHELMHAYYFEKSKKLGLRIDEYSDGIFPCREVGLGYCIWKEFSAQGMSKSICAANGVFDGKNPIEELTGFLRDVIERSSGEGLIGMFFANLLFDGKISKDVDRRILLGNLLQKYDEDIQEFFFELYPIILASVGDDFLKGFDEEVLTTIGELADGIKMKADVYTTMKFILEAISGNLQMQM